jgi:Tfp pilus assembly protein PilF
LHYQVQVLRIFYNTLLLGRDRKDHDQAEAYYKKSLELEPDNANFNGNYAPFLTNIRKNHDQAEAYYKKSLELEPRVRNCH